MSVVSEELRDVIAEANEPEPDEAEAEEEAEQERAAEKEPEPEPEPPTDAVMEKIGQALDREAERHTKAVAKIMGDQMGDLVTCPLCITPGFVTVEPPHDFDPMQREAVLIAIGDAAAKLKTHPRFERCDLCDGFGKLTTGARNEPMNNAINCEKCQSRGYVDPQEVATIEAARRDATYVPPPNTSGTTSDTANGTSLPPRPEPWLDYGANPPVWRI